MSDHDWTIWKLKQSPDTTSLPNVFWTLSSLKASSVRSCARNKIRSKIRLTISLSPLPHHLLPPVNFPSSVSLCKKWADQMQCGKCRITSRFNSIMRVLREKQFFTVTDGQVMPLSPFTFVSSSNRVWHLPWVQVTRLHLLCAIFITHRKHLLLFLLQKCNLLLRFYNFILSQFLHRAPAFVFTIWNMIKQGLEEKPW